MRLKLVSRNSTVADAGRNFRVLEGGGELTLGRGRECGWRIADAPPAMGAVEARVFRDGRGWRLRDEGMNGVTVDGATLVEGQSTELRDGSTVSFCGFRFTAEITGVAEPDWTDPDPGLRFGDDAPSITAILADVAPTGGTARGPLPGRFGDLALEEIGRRPPQEEREPVPVGWQGPPDTAFVPARIPDDWNTASPTASHAEHMTATSARMRLPQAAGERERDAAPVLPDVNGPDADALIAAFLEGARFAVPATEGAGDPVRFMRRIGEEMRTLADGVAALETIAADFLDGLAATGRPRADATRPLAERMGACVEAQRRILGAVETVAEAAAREFDPRAIEAKADEKAAALGPLALGAKLLPGQAERGYWRAYRDACGPAGGGFFAARLAAALGSDDTTGGDAR
ncbi:FHA domain-containing protein [Aureimonas leprariae]|uniref:FHA domain-containing protein n=1 Tax=Plantimonas leprariae TaxID=2615207 RepID=A0A7V7PQ48_9HYPH|nr:FHA domain-containing protein [Aureimonas leprariae]KAB0680236.1 FHA domain-containing protein [Aureimonas leprariae]